MADLLKQSGIDCKIILLSGERFSEDGSYYFEICKKHEIPYEIYSDKTDLSNFNTILDCILGTGFSGDVRGVTADAINAINSSGAYVVSTDINSGLNGDTGEGVIYVKSDLTISIGTFKQTTDRKSVV